MTCITVTAMNLFLAITSLEIESVGDYFVVNSENPARYTYHPSQEVFCLETEKEHHD